MYEAKNIKKHQIKEVINVTDVTADYSSAYDTKEPIIEVVLKSVDEAGVERVADHIWTESAWKRNEQRGYFTETTREKVMEW